MKSELSGSDPPFRDGEGGAESRSGGINEAVPGSVIFYFGLYGLMTPILYRAM